jgi:alanyl-tRNA synthetase
MQQFKSLYSDVNFHGTLANVQSCLRVGDLDEIGDGTHLLYFNMVGLFSFRQFSVKDAIDFWLAFLGTVGAFPDYVTIHPDKLSQWAPFYSDGVPIRSDPECTWSDGDILGYSTEFYKNGVEIGNIVNPLGTCIDVGFGLERLDMVVAGTPPLTPQDTLTAAIERIIASDYRPGNKQQGYVLRKLLRRLWVSGGSLDHRYFRDEVERQKRLKKRYDRLKAQYPDKSPGWWFDTHGIDVSEIEEQA